MKLKKFFKKHKNKLFIVLGVILLLGLAYVGVKTGVIAQSALTGGTLQSFNRGGGYFLTIGSPDIPGNKYDPVETSVIELRNDFSLYPGTGWDNMCFYGMILSIVSEDNFFEDRAIEGYSHEFGTLNHDADKRNIPFKNFYQQNLDISDYDNGNYKIDYYVVMTEFNDRPNIGECISKGNWDGQLAAANTEFNLQTMPVEWLNSMAGKNLIRTNHIKTFIFSIESSDQIPGEEEEEQPPADEEQPSQVQVPGFLLLLVFLAVILVFAGLIYSRRKKKNGKKKKR